MNDADEDVYEENQNALACLAEQKQEAKDRLFKLELLKDKFRAWHEEIARALDEIDLLDRGGEWNPIACKFDAKKSIEESVQGFADLSDEQLEYAISLKKRREAEDLAKTD